MFHQATSPKAHASEVLTRAAMRVGERLALPDRVLARILGVSSSTISRLPDRHQIAPDTKEGELAILLVRLFRSLDALLGGDAEKCRAWFHAHNIHLQGVPVELVQKVTGLVNVIEYLDAMRGKI